MFVTDYEIIFKITVAQNDALINRVKNSYQAFYCNEKDNTVFEDDYDYSDSFRCCDKKNLNC